MKKLQVSVSDNLQKNFIIPPYSIIDAKQGYYAAKRKAWKSKVNDNAEARSTATTFGKFTMQTGNKLETSQVSILDPLLCEILLHWFNTKNGSTFDCFAGDSSFGFVSASKKCKFTGVELRQEQADFNTNNLIANNINDFGTYICDDGRNITNHISENSQDMFFSCPPYYDLEVYSDHVNDASNQETYEDFLQIIETALHNSMKCLKDNRFAIIVIGDIRDKDGFYRSMEYDFVTIMKKVGVKLYNHIILADQLTTAHLRAGRNMINRKTVKVHQNVLVFYKGNPKEIQSNFETLMENVEFNAAMEKFKKFEEASNLF